MTAYKIETAGVSVAGTAATKFSVGFGDPSDNDEIVKAAAARMKELAGETGQLALVNGPASLPAAVVIAHALTHRFGAVAVFDPKMGSYIVAAAHGGNYSVGDIIPAEEVGEA